MVKKATILVVTCNPSLDRILHVPNIRVGSIHRSKSARVTAGGKGLNVTRALTTIIGTNDESELKVLNSGILSGDCGKYFANLAAEEGVVANWWWLPDDGRQTRTCLLISSDSTANDSTVFNEEGPSVTVDEWKQFSQHVISIATDCDTIMFCGSLPCGISGTDFGNLVHTLAVEHNKNVFVDSSRVPLSAVVEQPQNVSIKVNQSELLEVMPSFTPDQLIVAAKTLISRGAKQVIITRGAQGAVLVTESSSVEAMAPDVDAVSSVGCGDTFHAAFAYQFTSHQSTVGTTEDLAFAIACGSASAENDVPGKFDLQRALQLQRIILEHHVNPDT